MFYFRFSIFDFRLGVASSESAAAGDENRGEFTANSFVRLFISNSSMPEA